MFDFDELDSAAKGRAAAERFRRLPGGVSLRHVAEESEEEAQGEALSSTDESLEEDEGEELRKGKPTQGTEDLLEKESREKRTEDPSRRAQLERFERDLELELEAEERCRQAPEEGLLGALMRVTLPASGGGGQAFFVDAMNVVFERTRELIQKHSADKGLCLRVEECRRRTLAVGAVLAPLVLARFRRGALRNFERLSALFATASTGVISLYSDWLGGPVGGGALVEAKGRVDRAFAEVLTTVRALMDAVVPVGDDSSLDAEEVEWRREEERAWLEGIVRRPARLVTGALGLPQVDPGNALLVVLRASESGEELEIPVSRRTTAKELKGLLVDCLGHDAGVELLRCESGSSRAALRPLAPSTPLQKLQGTAIVLNGAAMLLPSSGNLPGKDASAVAAEVVLGTLGEARLVRFQRLLRTNDIAIVQLLHELRERFRNEPQLCSGSVELDERERAELVLKIQCQVLPKHGFEGSPAGVQAMRYESSFHSESDPVVAKLMKDIHQVLDLRAPLPKLPVVRALEPPRFVAHQPARWLRHLNDEGFVVIAGATSEDEVARAYRLLWQFIERSDASGKVRRADVSSWRDTDASSGDSQGVQGWPAGKDDGIIHKRGIGQSRALWYLRGLPGIRSVFAYLWGTEQLVTSLDGAGVFRPYGHNKQWRTKRKSWFHVDQAHRKRGLHCVQGLVTLKDATPQSGGLVVVPRSHRFHGDILKRYAWSDWNFIRLDADDPVLTEGNSGPRLVCARAGDLILWDSRTVHCNTAPLEEDEGLLHSQDLIRAVAYVCMTPAAWCTASTFRERKRAVKRGITTAHWPHDFQIMSAHDEFPQPSLSGQQRELLCPKAADIKLARSAALGGGVLEGRVSLFPPRKFTVVVDSVPILQVATSAWGRRLGHLPRDSVVEGHRLGMWLRLTSWPEGSLPDGSPTEEAWVPVDGRELGLDPEPLVVGVG